MLCVGFLCSGIETYTNMTFLVENNGLGRHWLTGNAHGDKVFEFNSLTQLDLGVTISLRV